MNPAFLLLLIVVYAGGVVIAHDEYVHVFGRRSVTVWYLAVPFWPVLAVLVLASVLLILTWVLFAFLRTANGA